jgi:hypothetical protein
VHVTDRPVRYVGLGGREPSEQSRAASGPGAGAAAVRAAAGAGTWPAKWAPWRKAAPPSCPRATHPPARALHLLARFTFRLSPATSPKIHPLREYSLSFTASSKTNSSRLPLRIPKTHGQQFLSPLRIRLRFQQTPYLHSACSL